MQSHIHIQALKATCSQASQKLPVPLSSSQLQASSCRPALGSQAGAFSHGETSAFRLQQALALGHVEGAWGPRQRSPNLLCHAAGTLQSELPPPSLRKPGAVLLNPSGTLGDVSAQLADVLVWPQVQWTSLEPLPNWCWPSKTQASFDLQPLPALLARSNPHASPQGKANPHSCPTPHVAASFAAQFAACTLPPSSAQVGSHS